MVIGLVKSKIFLHHANIAELFYLDYILSTNFQKIILHEP